MDQYFSNKIALVTGAGSGIGRSLTLKLVELGCQVIAVSRDTSKLKSLKEEAGPSATITTVSVDLASWKETNDSLAPLCANVDFLINNAGYGYCDLIGDIVESEIQRSMNVNLVAPMNLIRLVSPGMRQRRFGSIVNVSSVSGISALDGHAVYAATKSGLDMVTKVCAKELGPFNVRVNSVNPTVVWTELGSKVWSEPKRKAEMLSKIPMNRFVEISEVVDPVIFLLRPDAGMINGITLPIDGGFAAN